MMHPIEELTGLTSARLPDLDHVRRNVTLRKALLETDIVDDLFVLSDDDYRRSARSRRSSSLRTDRHRLLQRPRHWPGDETDFDPSNT
jgi:hypothetical protein